MAPPLLGGCTFAEDPALPAPDARIIWDAALDPGTLRAVVTRVASDHPDALAPETLDRWLTIVDGVNGQHAVLSDGWRRVRLDLIGDGLRTGPVLLRYEIVGIATASRKLLPLRRFLDLSRRGRFAPPLYPADPRVARWLLALRVHDAIAAGASQGDMIRVLFGGERGPIGIDRRDSLRSRVRRLVARARRFAAGDWRTLLRE